MRMMDASFEAYAYETLLSGLQAGQLLSASRLLAALDGEAEEIWEDAFAAIKAQGVLLTDDLPAYAADSQSAVRLRREAQLVKQGDLLRDLEETDPLRLYLEELAGIPAWGDENLLAENLCRANQDGDVDEIAQTALMNLSLSRVVELAKTYAGKGVLLLDLIQEGSMGLWEALSQYAGGDFGAFRDGAIRNSMIMSLLQQYHAAGVGRKMREAMEDYRAVDERLLGELGRNPTLEEISEALHMTPAETAVVADMVANARNLQRAKAPEPEVLPQEEDQAVEDTAYFQMRQRIAELLSVLPETDAKLLTLRYGLENGRPMTAQQAGQVLGLTPEEVNQREAAALAKMRSGS